MKTITFFSYKGGNGRTLTAANFAVYLTKLGLKVAIMDFDLDAPGVDSKFPGFELAKGQLGLIDYVLRFQREGSPPGPIEQIYCTIPIKSPRQDYVLGLIPAGDYVASDYPAKLNELNWPSIFSSQRDGVAFFQLFLQQIKKDLGLDVLVIDSRTGFSEIGGLCTQQLAHETVILTSLAAESIKMTRHLAQVIRESEISKRLNKTVETKVVVSRLPKPDDMDKLKANCCESFGVEESKLLFLFSFPALETEEFVAMLETDRDKDLVSNYVQLFQGLAPELATPSIRNEITRATQDVFSCKPEEAAKRVREIAAIYPHPEVYRFAMQFFALTKERYEACLFGLRLLDVSPADKEAKLQVTRLLLAGRFHSYWDGIKKRFTEDKDIRRMISIAEDMYTSNLLSLQERIGLAEILGDAGRVQESFDIAKACIDSAQIDDRKLRTRVISIAIRAAMILLPENRQDLLSLIPELPRENVVRLADETGKRAEIEELINELAESRPEDIPF